MATKEQICIYPKCKFFADGGYKYCKLHIEYLINLHQNPDFINDIIQQNAEIAMSYTNNEDLR